MMTKLTMKDAEKIVRENIRENWRVRSCFDYGKKYVFAIKRYEGDFGYAATVNKKSGQYSDQDFLFSRERPWKLKRALKTLVFIDEDFES